MEEVPTKVLMAATSHRTTAKDSDWQNPEGYLGLTKRLDASDKPLYDLAGCCLKRGHDLERQHHMSAPRFGQPRQHCGFWNAIPMPQILFG